MRPLLARHSHDRTAPRPRAKQDCAPQGLKGMSCQRMGIMAVAMIPYQHLLSVGIWWTFLISFTF